jgi:hypothetical protein
MVGKKVGTKEISGALRTGGESLSKTPRAAPTQSAKQPTNQTNKTGKKTIAGQSLGRRGAEKARRKRGKRAKEKGVKHRTKGREHQVNCLVQRVEDNERRGVAKATPPPTCAALTETGARVY